MAKDFIPDSEWEKHVSKKPRDFIPDGEFEEATHWSGLSKKTREKLTSPSQWNAKEMLKSYGKGLALLSNPLTALAGGVSQIYDLSKALDQEEQLKAGYQESLPGLVQTLVTGKKPFKDVKAPKPQGLFPHLIRGIGGYGPDAPLFIAGTVGGGGVGGTALQTGGKQLVRQGIKQVVKKGLRKQGLKSIASGLGKSTLGHAITGAASFGTAELPKSPLRQLVQEDKYSFGKHAKDVGEAMLTGAITEPMFVAGGKVVGAPFKLAKSGIRRLALGPKGYKIPVEASDLLWQEANQEASKVFQATKVNKRIGNARFKLAQLEDRLMKQQQELVEKATKGLSTDVIKSEAAAIKKAPGRKPVIQQITDIDPNIVEGDVRWAAKQMADDFTDVANSIKNKTKRRAMKQSADALNRLYESGREYGPRGGGYKNVDYWFTELHERASKLAQQRVNTPGFDYGKMEGMADVLPGIKDQVQRLQVLERTGKHRGSIRKILKDIEKQKKKIKIAESQARELPEISDAINKLESVAPDIEQRTGKTATELATEEIMAAAPNVVEGRTLAIKRPLITGKIKAGELRNQIYRQKLQKLGVDPYMLRKGEIGRFEKLLNMSELLDKIERQSGARVGEYPVKFYEAAARKGHFLEAMQNRAVAIQQKAEQAGVTPQRLSDLLDYKATKAFPENEAEQVLYKEGRKLLDDMREYGVSLGHDIKYREGYLPRRDIIPLKDTTGARFRKPLPEEAILKAEKARTAKYGTALQERDAFKLFERYAKEIGNAEVLNVVPEAADAIMRLRATGHEGVANQIEDWIGKMTGLSKEQGQRLFASDFVNRAGVDMDRILKILDFQNKDVGNIFLNELSNMMYKSWIGINPRTLLKQRMQTNLVGSAEIGHNYVKYGKNALKKMDKTTRALLEQNDKNLVGPSLDWYESSAGKTRAGGTARKMLDIAEKPSKPGFTKFTEWDKRNRRIMFLGGHKQIGDVYAKTGSIEGALDGMLESQKRMVREAMSKGGIEAAQTVGGLIRSHRVNYMYSLADKPLMLQNALGDLIPFTTWGRNQWNRYIGDISQGNIKMIAKRIVYPLMYLKAFEMITGYKIPYAHPIQSLHGALDIGLLPALGQPVVETLKGEPGKAVGGALSIAPPARGIALGAKTLKKGPMEGFMGLEKSETFPGLIQMIAPLIMKQFKSKEKPREFIPDGEWE